MSKDTKIAILQFIAAVLASITSLLLVFRAPYFIELSGGSFWGVILGTAGGAIAGYFLINFAVTAPDKKPIKVLISSIGTVLGSAIMSTITLEFVGLDSLEIWSKVFFIT